MSKPESDSKINVQQNVPHANQRDIESEIDWKFIDMFHNVVLNFSRNSMQAKKIMFTLLGIFLAEVLRNPVLYVNWLPVIIIIIVLFWAFDAYTYYYQEKFRALMDERFSKLRKRHLGEDTEEQDALPNNRQKSGIVRRVCRSVFNMSILFYPVIIIIILIFYRILIRLGDIA